MTLLVLGIESSTIMASVCVMRDGVVVAEIAHDTSGKTAALLVGVDRACVDAGVTARDFDAIVVGAGPGSFTGLRIGMATAKGIAFAIGKPLWAVSSLAALAMGGGREGEVVAVLDARKGEVYVGAFGWVGGVMTAVREERVIPPGELAAYAGGVENFVGDAIGAYPQLGELGTWTRATPTGSGVVRVALAGARVDVTTGGAPTYIRKSEAEVMYPDGVPGALRKR